LALLRASDMESWKQVRMSSVRMMSLLLSMYFEAW
jgi:hypothetical protein